MNFVSFHRALLHGRPLGTTVAGLGPIFTGLGLSKEGVVFGGEGRDGLKVRSSSRAACNCRRQRLHKISAMD